MKQFDKITKTEEMKEYLRDCLNRYPDDSFLFHYTDIETVINIIESGYLWLNDYNQMNDLFEKELLNQRDYDGNLFFICFSRGEESLAMYKMYGKGKGSAIIKIPVSVIKDILSYAWHGEYADGIDDDGEYYSCIRKTSVVDNGRVLKKTVNTGLYCTDIAYLNPYDSVLKYEDKRNNKIISPLNSEELVGMVKYNCWEYEREVRLYGRIIDFSNSINKIAIKLPDDICKKVQVILGPVFDKESYKEQLFYLRRLGVVYNNSIYDGLYKESNIRMASWREYHLFDYIHKKYEGDDPWEGKLSIYLKDFRNGELIWKWENIFNDGRKRRKIEVELSTILDNDYIGHYEISKRERISKDEKEYLSYEYGGSIQLVDSKVLITFNNGGLYSYVSGGGGASGYGGSGGWRMGMNLLSILTEAKNKE